MALARWKDLCIDAVDQRLVASFWADVIGLEVAARRTGHRSRWRWSARARDSGSGSTPSTGPSVAKHRVHLDVDASSVDELVALGARVLRRPRRRGWRGR